MEHKKSPSISIIVPIYNAERYLKQCLHSIRSQTFRNWECILVDDGSTDSSPFICDCFAAEDSRFKVIHKENTGVADTRNCGLDMACADLIGFVDSDDWIEPQMYEKLYNLINEYDADIAQVGYWTEYKHRRSVKHIVKHPVVLCGEEALEEIVFNRMPSYLWNRLHHRRIINCKFPQGHTYEDVFVYGHWLKNVKKFMCDPIPLYHYRKRKGSIIHTIDNKLDYFSTVESILNLDAESKFDNIALQNKITFLNKTAVNVCKKLARDIGNKEKRINEILKIRNILVKYPLLNRRSYGLKVWYRSKLLRENPSFFSWMMRFVNKFDIDTKIRNRNLFD